ncbi:TIGR03915 family putative DNA repair protein [Bacteroidales bacterium OttesenSCG-928-I14]|nr:TIGR03915 family putative DNA repair protein [Bacteroidales bacterium OttesenSCG-928-I14]
MLYYIYDHTFEGLLSAVFDAYNRKEQPDRIIADSSPTPLFVDTHIVVSDKEKTDRVFNGLKKKLSASALNMLFVCYLSELEDIELSILRYIQKTFSSPISIEINFGDDDVLYLSKIFKKVQNEKTHIYQFVRFQKTADGMFFSIIEPKYNVLPLCIQFFQDRYADQAWIIYDSIRKYGVHYDGDTSEIVHFDKLDLNINNGKLKEENLNNEEVAFQDMWKSYLKSITIQERRNLKLQRQHMPKRFWKYLTEKN